MEKNVKVTSQMKEINGRKLPSSDKLFVLDRVMWSLSNIFSMYTSPIRDSAPTETEIESINPSLSTLNNVEKGNFIHHGCGSEREPD